MFSRRQLISSLVSLAMLAALSPCWAADVSWHNDVEAAWKEAREQQRPLLVFVTTSGYKVIDWQRPQLAPAQVDLAALLERTPYLFRHVEPAAIGVFYFLRLFWAVNAKANLLPHMQHLFDWWSSEAIGYIRRASEASP